MKKNFFLIILCLACLLVGLVNACKKDPSINPPPTDIGTATSFTEEFENVYQLETKGWVIKDYSASPTVWGQGTSVLYKGIGAGFPAYSYTASQDEYVSASVTITNKYYSVSSWLITPVLSVKNGDKISFYTRAAEGGVYKERMQVLINKSASTEVGDKISSVGGFTNVLFDINSAQAAGGYPTTWTKYEYTFSGISGKTDTRIGFRYFVPETASSRAIGIDQFKFQVN